MVEKILAPVGVCDLRAMQNQRYSEIPFRSFTSVTRVQIPSGTLRLFRWKVRSCNEVPGARPSSHHPADFACCSHVVNRSARLEAQRAIPGTRIA